METKKNAILCGIGSVIGIVATILCAYYGIYIKVNVFEKELYNQILYYGAVYLIVSNVCVGFFINDKNVVGSCIYCWFWNTISMLLSILDEYIVVVCSFNIVLILLFAVKTTIMIFIILGMLLIMLGGLAISGVVTYITLIISLIFYRK